MDTRLQQLHTERSQQGAQPLPTNVSFADVIGNDFDAHKEGTHAFFLKLGDKTALALGFEKGIDGKGPTEIRYKGQPVKLGPLLRKPPPLPKRRRRPRELVPSKLVGQSRLAAG